MLLSRYVDVIEIVFFQKSNKTILRMKTWNCILVQKMELIFDWMYEQEMIFTLRDAITVCRDHIAVEECFRAS